MAASVTVTHYALGQVRRIEIAWVAAANGAVTATALPAFEGRLLALVTDPGSTAPTDNYDITLPATGIGDDRLQGVGMNRHTSTTQSAPIVYSGSTVHPWVDLDETLTFTLENNAVNGGNGLAVLFYTPSA